MAFTSDLAMPVASVGHLIALKLLARHKRERPNGADDLRRLAEAADAAEWVRAESAVGSIVERGFHHGRDLADLPTDLRRESERRG